MIKLSLESSSNIDLPINYTNIPENKILINKPDTLLSLRVRSKGFRVFSDKYFRSFEPFLIDLGNLKLSKENNKYSAYILTSIFDRKINRDIKSEVEVLSISPDTLYFELMDVEVKRVPVKLMLEYSLKKQYFLYDSIRISPDSLTITGPADLLKAVSFVENNTATLKDIDATQTLALAINTENISSNIVLSGDSIKVYLNVEQYTEAEVEVPVETIKGAEGISLRTFPDKVKITYLVALKDYKKVEASMFEAVVNYEGSVMSQSSKLKVELRQTPKFTKVTRITPEKVEFIIYK